MTYFLEEIIDRIRYRNESYIRILATEDLVRLIMKNHCYLTGCGVKVAMETHVNSFVHLEFSHVY